MATHRFYDCGCAPEFEEFCKEADKRVWQEREAAQLLFLIETPSAEEHERIVRSEREARIWLCNHYKHMELFDKFTDHEESDEEPPDDGYDEDPRVVGQS